MMHAGGVCHPICAGPASQYGPDSLSTSRLAAAAGDSKAGAGPAEGPPNQRTAELCCCKGCAADILDLNAHCTEDYLD